MNFNRTELEGIYGCRAGFRACLGLPCADRDLVVSGFQDLGVAGMRVQKTHGELEHPYCNLDFVLRKNINTELDALNEQ